MNSAALDERDHYRAPEAGDPIYALELACIEIARKATIAANGYLYLAFAPKPTIFERLTGRSKDRHAVYSVPRVKTVFWLWEKYRPNPWIHADNRKVLEGWLRILYREMPSGETSQLVQELVANGMKPYVAPRGAHVVRSELWRHVARLVSETLRPYA